jgi:hypothetical protein
LLIITLIMLFGHLSSFSHYTSATHVSYLVYQLSLNVCHLRLLLICGGATAMTVFELVLTGMTDVDESLMMIEAAASKTISPHNDTTAYLGSYVVIINDADIANNILT